VGASTCMRTLLERAEAKKMIFEDIVQYLRVTLDDYETEDSPQQYTDEQLSKLIVISIRYLQSKLRIPKGSRIETSLEPMYVDPFIDINDDFIELIVLKSLCALQKRNIENQFGTVSLTASLGPATIKTGSATWGRMPKHIWDSTSPCAELDRKLLEWITFDPRKLHVIYSVLPGRGQGGRTDNRMQSTGVPTGTEMIQ